MKRTDFLATAAVAGLTMNGAPAGAAGPVPGGTDFVERKSAFDSAAFDALLGRPGDIHQVWESVAFKPSVFNNIKNALNGLQFGFGYPADRVTLAVANHGPSSAYAYTDEIWTKYRIGDYFKMTDKDGATIASNVFYPAKSTASTSSDPNDPASPLQDTSIAALQQRGVIFLTCHTAVEEQARGLVAAGHAPSAMNASDVAADILTHLIPGAVVVPSMVATIAVLQHRFAYSYITIQS